MSKNWYVVPCEAGKENRVKALLEMRRFYNPESVSGLKRILIPLNIESKITESGRQVCKKVKLFYGSVLIEMRRNTSLDTLLRNTPAVVNTSDWKIVKDSEIPSILERMIKVEEPLIQPKITKGVSMMVKSGSLEGYQGKVEEIRGSRVVIIVDVLGSGMKIEIEANELEFLV